jgi:hypothetical protein
MSISAANGASGLTASFLPVLQASLQRNDEQNSVSKAVTENVAQQIDSGLQSAASSVNDVASVALTGRGQKLDISA